MIFKIVSVSIYLLLVNKHMSLKIFILCSANLLNSLTSSNSYLGGKFHQVFYPYSLIIYE